MLASRVTVSLQAEEGGILAISADSSEHAPWQQDVLKPAEAVAGECQARCALAGGDLSGDTVFNLPRDSEPPALTQRLSVVSGGLCVWHFTLRVSCHHSTAGSGVLEPALTWWQEPSVQV